MDHLLTRHSLKWICISAHERAQWVLVHSSVPSTELTTRQVLGRLEWAPIDLTWSGFVGPDLVGTFSVVHCSAFQEAKQAVLKVFDEQAMLANQLIAEITMEENSAR